MTKLQACLDYCQQQNGLPYCKNCGLNQERIDEAVYLARVKAFEEAARCIEEARGELPPRKEIDWDKVKKAAEKINSFDDETI